MIKLYYVRGINRFDTPYFPTIYAQEDYFENKLVSIMSDSFYPPHYTNKINISIEDLSFNSQINYLSIEFQGKTYYYFIDQIRYVTEDLMEISITMDTIQTYMFNIDFISSEVGRKLINRWNGNKINRDYIRENISNGEFQLENYINYSENEICLILVKFITPTPTLFRNELISLGSDGGCIGVIPFVDYRSDFDSIVFPRNPNFASTKNKFTKSGYMVLIQNILKLPNVTNVYLVDNNFINIGTSITIENNERILNISYPYPINYNWVNIFQDDPIDTETFMMPYLTNAKVGTIIKHFSFAKIKNTDTTATFSMNYVPQLIDNNYIKFYFGEKGECSTLPLEKILSTNLEMVGGLDIFTGGRNYMILEDNVNINYELLLEEYNRDIYDTNITHPTPIAFSLISDKWLEFQAFNYGFDRLRQAEYDKNMTSGVYGALSQVFMKGPHESAVGMLKGMQTGGKAGAIIGAAKGIGDTINTTTDIIVSTAIEDKYLKEVTLATKENAQYSPSSFKSSNSPINSYMSREFDIIQSLWYVEDILDVAKNFEGYGYKVHEQYSNTNLFEELNTRFYFNIIQCDKLNITLVDIISDEYTLYNITNRFNVGLRLWNVENGDIGEYLYIYDNVEKDYL